MPLMDDISLALELGLAPLTLEHHGDRSSKSQRYTQENGE